MRIFIAVLLVALFVWISVYQSLSNWHYQRHLRLFNSFGFLAARSEADGNFFEAESYYKLALNEASEIYRVLQSDVSLTKSKNDLADFYRRQGHFAKAHKLYDDVMQIKHFTTEKINLESGRAFLGMSLLPGSSKEESEHWRKLADKFFHACRPELAEAARLRTQVNLAGGYQLNQKEGSTNVKQDPFKFLRLVWRDQNENQWHIRASRTAEKWRIVIRMMIIREMAFYKSNSERLLTLCQDLIDLSLFKDSENILRQAVKDRLPGSGPAEKTLLLDCLGQCLYCQDRYTEAKVMIDEAIRISEPLKDSRIQSYLILHKAQIVAATGDGRKALSLIEALLKEKQSLKIDNPDFLWYLYRELGRSQLICGFPQEAVKDLERSIDYARKSKTISPSQLAMLTLSLGEAKLQAGDIQGGRKTYMKGFELQYSLPGMKKRSDYARVARQGILYAQAHNYKASLNMDKWALELKIGLYGPKSPLLKSMYSRLIIDCEKLGDFDQAQMYKDKIQNKGNLIPE